MTVLPTVSLGADQGVVEVGGGATAADGRLLQAVAVRIGVGHGLAALAVGGDVAVAPCR